MKAYITSVNSDVFEIKDIQTLEELLSLIDKHAIIVCNQKTNILTSDDTDVILFVETYSDYKNE